VAGDARVLPGIEVPVRVRTDGVLRAVAVRSGQEVRAGQYLGQMDPVPAGARMAELRAAAQEARGQSAAAEAGRDPVERRLAELRREQAVARLAALQHEAGRTELVAPVSGTVLTPLVEERVGDWFEMGDIFCQVSPLDTLFVEVAIDEVDVHRIRPGSELRIKVLAFPDRQFRGQVASVSWVGERPRPGQRSHFLVRGWVVNPGPSLRTGMTGRARVEAGNATLLWRVTRDLLRGLRLWIWV
jgi:multidrug resistance efflux pump